MAANRGDARLGAAVVRLWERLQPRAFSSLPCEGRGGLGRGAVGSARTVTTPSQPPPAFAGGGAKPQAEIASRSWWQRRVAANHSSAARPKPEQKYTAHSRGAILSLRITLSSTCICAGNGNVYCHSWDWTGRHIR